MIRDEVAALRAITRVVRTAIAAGAGVERGCPVVSAWRVKEWADQLDALIASLPPDDGVAETAARHSADCRAQEAVRTREAEALQPRLPPAETDNHHNALTCPHCNPKGLTFAETGWQLCSVKHPKPHARYLIRRDGVLFMATPCYGMHNPWWVVKTLEGEAPPVAILDTDEWMPLPPPTPS